MINPEELKFDENGLIPAIVVDAVSKKVLTLAYMNRESLKISMERGLTCFWSRSRQQLWLKGETSGNYQHIVSITADCDRDALVVMVEKDGPACHTGSDSCFTAPVWQSEAGVRMIIGKLHFVIFSCLTFWSMMWRDASSRCTSSTRIPICTISTMT